MSAHPPVNPYIAGSPITGTDMFYGREDVFAFIRRNLIGLHRDTPVVLYGQRRTGKTSVLYQLHRHLDPGYRCIFIDLHGISLDGMGNLLAGIANSISRSLRRDHQLTVEVPERAAFLAEPRSGFEVFLDRVWSAMGEGRLVLMIDEAIRLDEEVKAGRLDREVFNYLRHLMQHYPSLSFIFSLGSGLEEMKKDYAFLFSVALYHRITFLETAAADKLITWPARDHYLVEPEAVSKILQLTSGHPYYTQLVCHCVFDLWSRDPKPVIDVPDVDAVLAEAIELGSANLTFVWEDSTSEEQALMAAMAAAMGDGARPVTLDFARAAWSRVNVVLPEREAARALRSLAGREVLAGSQTYAFTVDLQRLWLDKHRRLDWVKDELTEAIRHWKQSAESGPADTAPLQADRPGPMAELKVFISYRRDTDAARAVILDKEISGAFNYPEETRSVVIYRDTSKRLDVPWPQELRDRCSAADIVLVVIGPNWLEARDQYARRRIDQPDDWVRQEIELALAGNKIVIPVIFGGVGMLPPEVLPESIAGLAERRGVIARDEFPDDLQPVLGEIELHLSGAGRRSMRTDIGGDHHNLPYPDPPLLIKPVAMTETDINITLSKILDDWEIVTSPLPEDPYRVRMELHRDFEFHTFLDVLTFMAETGDFADKVNHHPRWENIYRTLRVYLTTWDIGHGISHLDVQLAQFFDRAYESYLNKSTGDRRFR